MTEQQVSALLGRPLSSIETTNFNTYIALAKEYVGDMICSCLYSEIDEKSFVPRRGYTTLPVPVFTEIYSVKINDEEVTNYHTRQGSSLNGSWFNSLVFDSLLDCETVTIEADWGFTTIPLDLQKMIAEEFSLVSGTLGEDLIQSKRVEDFSITLKDETKQQAFADKYRATIAKYSGCANGNVQSGDVRRFYYI